MEYNPHTGSLIERPKTIGIAIAILWVSFCISAALILYVLSQTVETNLKRLALYGLINGFSCISLVMAARVLNQKEKTAYKRGSLLVRMSIVIPMVGNWFVFGKPQTLNLLSLVAVFLLMGKKVKSYYESF